jgi:periodic tryptophan protein 2
MQGTQLSTIEGRNDLGSGRGDTDLVTAKKNLQGKAFNTICYTADGQCLLAAGQSKNICIYQVLLFELRRIIWIEIHFDFLAPGV